MSLRQLALQKLKFLNRIKLSYNLWKAAVSCRIWTILPC